jgi:hypothetical protein
MELGPAGPFGPLIILVGALAIVMLRLLLVAAALALLLGSRKQPEVSRGARVVVLVLAAMNIGIALASSLYGAAAFAFVLSNGKALGVALHLLNLAQALLGLALVRLTAGERQRAAG